MTSKIQSKKPSKRRIYNSQVAPLLKAAMNICEANDMGFLSAVDIGKDWTPLGYATVDKADTMQERMLFAITDLWLEDEDDGTVSEATVYTASGAVMGKTEVRIR